MKTFSFDAETNGLWGQAFAIGALVYDEDGNEIDRFVARLSYEHVTDQWVVDNVLPEVKSIPVTHVNYISMLNDFSAFYINHKEGADIIVHMGMPVESRLLIDMHDLGLIGDRDGPFPLIDVAGNLDQAGEDPTSVDAYCKKHQLHIGEFEGGEHNPLYDSAVAYAAYRHLKGE